MLQPSNVLSPTVLIWWVHDSCAFVLVVSVISFVEDGAQSDDLLRLVFMGCATKNAKVVAVSLGSLQRLIALKVVPQSAMPLIINTMSVAMSQAINIQLHILQTLVSPTTNFPSVNGGLLGEIEVTLPDGTATALGLFVRGAYIVFEDLCLLANLEKPHFHNLEYLHKMRIDNAFGRMEYLILSELTGYDITIQRECGEA
jgi:hypothetical protein